MNRFSKHNFKIYFLLLLLLGEVFCFDAYANGNSQRVAAKPIPVILIHGIGGSDLTYRKPVKKDERGIFGNGFPNDVLRGFPGSPQNLQLDEYGQPRADSISKDIKAVKFYDVPGKNITDLSKYLQKKSYAKNKTLFEFFYDFRFSIESNAKELNDFIEKALKETGNPEVDIVAHSLGGLIAKQYLIDEPDANRVRNLVFVGTPHLGAPKALKVLRYGDDLDVFVIDQCKLKRVAHNMPSVFSLLPSKEYFQRAGKGYFTDAADLDSDGERGTLSYDQMLVNLAKGRETRCPLNPRSDMPPFNNLSPYLIENASVKLHEKQDFWTKPDNVKVYVIAGYGQPTISGITEDKNQIIYVYTTEGDGTVPLISSEAVSADKTFYVNLAHLKLDHSQMIGAAMITEQIYSLLNKGEGIKSPDFETTRPAADKFQLTVRVTEK